MSLILSVGLVEERNYICIKLAIINSMETTLFKHKILKDVCEVFVWEKEA